MEESSHTEQPQTARSFDRRLLKTVGLTTLFLIILYLGWRVAFVWLLVFAGVLLGVCLSGATTMLRRYAALPRGLALSLVVVLLLALLGLFGWLAGPEVVNQLLQLRERIPEAVETLRQTLHQYAWGDALLRRMPSPQEVFQTDVFAWVRGFFSTTLNVLANVLVVFILGLYLAATPGLYIDGVVHLVPPRRRDRAREVFLRLGQVLRRWFLGRLASMAVVGVLIALGLWIAGVPLALPLGLVAALLSFVPYLGPILSTIPAFLIGLAESPTKALYVLVVFGLVQLMESYLVTPLIQKKAVSIPPALLITVQVLAGVLAGALGVLMATPLAVVVVVLVQMLYLEDVLGDTVEVLGQQE